MSETKTIKIKLISSPAGRIEPQKKMVRALGLRKMNQVVEKPDTPAFRGFVKKIPHLLAIVD
ncbi:MAG: 50S ribosomal protein L30 [Bryobacteraceae bacterium]